MSLAPSDSFWKRNRDQHGYQYKVLPSPALFQSNGSPPATLTIAPGAQEGLDNDAIIALALGIPGLIIAAFTLCVANRRDKTSTDQEPQPLNEASGVEMENITTLPETQEDSATVPQLPAIQRTCIHCGKQVVSVLVTADNGESQRMDITPNSPPLEDCQHR
jgi:hypothetical protein